ncbi:MAG: VCBS repeat-containing protein [Ruminococcus sp.]|nr:VCBS repeat-containing protein [Ruminococcus sp.]
MKRKGRFLLALFILLALLFTGGCTFPGFSSSASLMHPPKATGDKGKIQSALEEYAKSSYVLKYPKSGTNRSAITMKDLDGDEVEEAVATVTLQPDTDEAETHIYIIDKKGDKWKIVGDFKNKNNDIDIVEFGDMDGDGTTDILVGWSTYNVTQNELYCYLFGEEIQEINTNETYTNMAVGSFTNDKKSTVITMSLSSSDVPAMGRLISVDADGVVTHYETSMDSDIIKYSSVQTGYIDSKNLGVFVDGLNSSNRYNTQVLYFNDSRKQLENPVYSHSTNGVLATTRSTSTICEDIDNDGNLEIPIAKILPASSREELKNSAYETSWCNVNLQNGGVTVKSTVIINDNYGYSIYIPDEWIGNYTAYYNGDSSVLTFCYATRINNSSLCAISGNIVTYIVTLTEDWTNIGSKQGYTKMQDAGRYSYGCKIDNTSSFSITKDKAWEIFVPKEETDAMAIAPTEASK